MTPGFAGLICVWALPEAWRKGSLTLGRDGFAQIALAVRPPMSRPPAREDRIEVAFEFQSCDLAAQHNLNHDSYAAQFQNPANRKK